MELPPTFQQRIVNCWKGVPLVPIQWGVGLSDRYRFFDFPAWFIVLSTDNFNFLWVDLVTSFIQMLVDGGVCSGLMFHDSGIQLPARLTNVEEVTIFTLYIIYV